MSINLKSQSKFSDNLSVSLNYGKGYILPEYQFINYIVNDYSQNIEISFLKETTGKSEWHQVYNFPKYGLRFLYSTLGNNNILGQLYGLYPYAQIDLFKYKRIILFNEIGLGLSYVTKTFDLEKNYLNVAVGSHVNLHFNLRLGVQYQLSPKIKLKTNFTFDHFSNANTSEPNLGINYISWLNGLSFAIGDIKEKEIRDINSPDKSIVKELVINIGGKHSRALSSKYYLTNSISYEIRKKYFKALHLGIGGDIFYDTSVEDQLSEKDKEYNRLNNFQSGIHISQSIIYNRFSLTLQEGIYIGLKEKVENYFMYNRGIFKYNLTEAFSIRLSMKSHLHILDYPEIGIGIKL